MIADRWGVTDAEVQSSYPCDEIVAKPVLQTWRGVTVHAPTEAVWPWVRQIRLAPYSYDVLDNRGQTSPRTFIELADPVPGDPFTAVGGRSLGQVIATEPGRSLTGQILGAVMSYVLVSEGRARTRLLLKLVMRRGRPLSPVLAVGDLVMARRQLLNWKQLAEQNAP